jgi:hypothetical protein
MFLAYDKVPFTQYALYEAYALLSPGADAVETAYAIYGSSRADADMRSMQDAIRFAVLGEKRIPVEFTLFAIRDASGVAFDIYFLDEDGLFLAFAAGVAEADVVTSAVALAVEAMKDVTGFFALVRR